MDTESCGSSYNNEYKKIVIYILKMEDTKTPKRTRKPKTVKEEHNNIDSITFENTEK